MNRTLLAMCAIVVLLGSCKEHDPQITLTAPIVIAANLADTTYMGPATITAQKHNVLVEELTGASCANCPAGHIVLEGIVSSNPSGTINVIAIHPIGFSQANPVAGSKYDFRTDQGTNIYQRIYSAPNFMPGAGIDRVIYNGNLVLDRGSWPGAVSARTGGASTPVNLTVTSSYTEADSTAHIVVTTSYPKSISNVINVSVAIVEDSLLDLQEDGTTIDQNYVFNNIFREFANESSTYIGDAVVTTTPTPAGTVDIKTYTHKVVKAWDYKQCRVIAFVTNAAAAEVLQSAQCKLTGP